LTRKDLQALAITRLAESKALLRAHHPSGAYYLAGYSVECALKACIAKRTVRYEFPDKKRVDASYTHNLTELVRIAGLDQLREARVREDADFFDNWQIVQQWNERSRYDSFTSDRAKRLIVAIESRRTGVLLWLKRHW